MGDRSRCHDRFRPNAPRLWARIVCTKAQRQQMTYRPTGPQTWGNRYNQPTQSKEWGFCGEGVSECVDFCAFSQFKTTNRPSESAFEFTSLAGSGVVQVSSLWAAAAKRS
ncbi:MAG: hypothetical protein CK530_05565 [Planctomycetaceae bacterium]|nr:MAG: hypothetical protein CK530_05565 [Planctomycetaceae bacterium]